MSELKRTQLYETHVAAGASMVDFGGWEMPVQYPTGIVAEHLYTRHFCSLFDVSHMGRLLIEGPERLAFLQHVLSSNVAGLDLNMAQYCILPDEDGGAVDDAYLYRFEEERFLLVVNAANTEKDLMHLRSVVKDYDCTITDITSRWASIAVQGPKSKDLLTTLSGGVQVTEPMKNALNTLTFEGHEVKVAKTGYTGEPLGYEVYCRSEDAAWLWNRLVELGARVGADVPFCVVGGTCRCRGIGEQVEPVSPLPDCWLVLCKPPAGMSTPRAYALIDQFPLSRAQATEKMVGLLSAGDLRRVAGGLSNRFDETMKLQQVREIKRVMGNSGALGASMTGSGSAVFGIFDSEAAARACMQQLEGKGRLYLARPLSRSWDYAPEK